MQTMIRELNLKNFTKRKENNMLRVYGNKQKNEIQRELYVEPLDGSRRQLANRFYERHVDSGMRLQSVWSVVIAGQV